jgi:alcohol dehydrogenase class IV
MSFSILQPGRILFGRGVAAQAVGLVSGIGTRVLLVQGASASRSDWLAEGLTGQGAVVTRLSCGTEPTLPMLLSSLALGRAAAPDVVVALGGGAVIDLAKALAALIPATGDPMDHLEVVGKGLPLTAAPLPFVALPTTSGTGAEVTKNAVIGLPEHGRKVSLRDDRMIARVAIVDPALTDHCPRAVTLASGLDALTQVIEPYASCKATPYTDAITRPAIAPGLAALMRLMEGEDAGARDALAWTSLVGGLALANSGLGAVHGFAGVIGGTTGAPHGAICGALLGPVLAMNRARTEGAARMRLDQVCAILGEGLGVSSDDAPAALTAWARAAGLPRLRDMGLDPRTHHAVAEASQITSSMKGNPVALSVPDLVAVLDQA